MKGSNGKNSSRACLTCAHWSPHALYPFIGYCRVHSTMTFDDDACEKHESLNPRRGAFYWCLDCRMRLEGEEAVEHLSRGHRVYRSAYLEPDIREEIYDAF